MKKIKVIKPGQWFWLLLPIIFGIVVQIFVSSAIARISVSFLTIAALWATILWLARSGRCDEYVLSEMTDSDEPPPASRTP